jgi:hypothetical protein
VHEILDKSFVERWVMHYDLTREDPATSIASLETNAEYLETKKKELAGRLSPKQQGLIRLIEELRSQLVVHAKKLKNLKREVDEGNAARSESQFRLSPSDWLPEPLREMRLATYPLIRAMIDLLPGDHPGRDRALETWNAGRTILSERDKDQAQPRWLRGEQTRD